MGAGGSVKAFYTGLANNPRSSGTAFAMEFVEMALPSRVILELGFDSEAPLGAGMHAFVLRRVVTILRLAFGAIPGNSDS